MTTQGDAATESQAGVRIARTFAFSRSMVFAAWSSAEHISRWFCPNGFTVPHAKVEMRVGGPFEFCMRAPDGTEHWSRGRFVAVEPNERLVIEMDVQGPGGAVAMTALTTATFEPAPGGTRLTVEQTYQVRDPSVARQMIEGAPQGWAQTLDRLGAALAEEERARPAVRNVVHDSFTLERTYPAHRARVWAALTTAEGKSKWFVGPPGQWSLVERSMDIRAGGRERVVGKAETGRLTTFEATYLDVEERERLVYAYQMWLDDRKISVSLTTMELSETGEGTHLKITEQGAFLDGYDDAGSREAGTGDLLDRIGKSLEA
ncbi:MAG TPA: SRPBCC domain-containing protein [Caulobacteraceae bacterium]|jgi:uncharacterized protein YndB with AHSA1/START domain